MSGAAMSFPQNTRNFLANSGKALPMRERIADVVRGIPSKVLARATGRTSKAAERWKAGDNAVNIETLFALAREFDEVWEIVKEECGRANDTDEAVAMIEKMRDLLREKRQ